MTIHMTKRSTHPRRLWRSVAAVLLGFVAVVVLSLAYRSLYAVVGGYIAARLAPHAPMRHALALGIVGLAVGAAGAIVTITKYDLGPDWYPIGVALTGLLGAWLGGVLHGNRVRQAER